MKFLGVFLGLIAHIGRFAIVQQPGYNGANPIMLNTCVTADCGNCGNPDWKVPLAGTYQLSKFELFQKAQAGISGVRLSFTDGVNTIVSSQIGGFVASAGEAPTETHDIVQCVTGVTIKQCGPYSSGTKQKISAFILHLEDSTTLTIGTVVATDPAYYSATELGLLGFKGQLHEGPHGQSVTYSYSTGWVPYTDICASYSSLIDRTIQNMTVAVLGTATQDASFRWGGSLCCGPRKYTLTPQPTYMTLTTVGSITTLTVNPTSYSDEGSVLITLTVKMQNFPAAATITKTFTVTVTCAVTSITFDPSIPASKIINIGIDPQPVSIHFSITKTAPCIAAPVFTLTPSLGFVSFSSAGNSGTIVVNGATLLNIGTYTLTLTATQTITKTKSISLDIRDPCKTAVILTIPATLSAMTVIVPAAGTDVQTYTITTDVTQAYPTITCDHNVVLTPAAAYISLSPNEETITINKSAIVLPTDIGPTHSFSIKITSTNYPATVLAKTLTFNVAISCTVSSFTATSQPADATYYLNDGPTTSLPLSLTQVNNCQLPFTYPRTYKKNGTTISKPSWLTWSLATTTFSYDVTAFADVGVYEISTTATTSQLSKVYTFTLTVIHDCLKTILTGSINDMAIDVGQTPDSQTLSFTDSTATFHSNPTYCGSRIYTLSPTYSFLTIASGVLTLSTSNVADSGTYNPVTLQVQLQDYPSIVLTKTFTATINCNVYSLTWATTMPTTVTIQVGITPQPFTIPYSLTKLPACPQQTSVTYGPTLSFLSQTPSGDTGDLKVNGALQSDQNTYSMTLTGALNGVVSKFYFDIQIVDPCKTAVIQSTPASLSTMQVIMPTGSFLQQTYSMTTDVQVAYPSIVCNMVVFLSPSADFISLSANYLTITIDPTKITLPTQIGVHPFSLLIQTEDYGAMGSQKTLNFNVEIVCEVTHFVVTKPAQIFYTIIYSGSVGSAPFTWLQQSACQQPETFNVTYKKDNISLLTKPSFITYDSFTKSFIIDSSLKSDVGLYAITMTATIPQLDPGTGSNFAQSETFYINVRSDCIRSEIIDRSVKDMAAVIGSTVDSQDLYFDDTISLSHGDRSYCPQLYLLVPHMSFLNLVGSQLYMQPINPDDEGTYEVSLKVWYQDFPEIETIFKTFKVMVQCEILSWQIVKPLPVNVSYTILVDLELIVDYGLVAVPACKSVLIEFTPTMPFQTLLNVAASKITISSSNLKHQGTYPLQLSGKPKPPNVGAKSEQTIKVKLINLCNQALFESQQIPDVEVFMQSQKYTEIQLINFDEFAYYPKTKYENYDCGDIKYELISSETKTWVQLSGKTIVIDFKQAKQTNVSHQVTLQMSLKQYPAIQHEEYFNVTLSDASIQCISQPPVSLKLGSEESAFGVAYTMRTFDSLTPVFEPYMAEHGAQRDLIKGLTFNAGSKVFKFKSVDPDSLGTFEVGINFFYQEFSDYQVRCQMPLQLTYTVAFDGKDPKSQTILPGKKWSYKLPDYTDFFGYPARINLELGAAVDIFLFDPTTNTLVPKVDPDELINFIGSYQITMTIIDRVGGSETRTFTISIIDLKGNAQGESKVSFIPPPKPFIEKTTQFGQVRIGFTRPIVLPTFARYPIFYQEEFFGKNCTNGGFCELPKSRLLTSTDNSTSDEIVDEPSFSLSYNEEEERQAIEIVNRGLTKVNGTFEPIVKISVIPGSQSNYTMLGFLWNCTKMTNTYMDVDVFYDHVMEVSAINEDKEKIRVSFYGRKYFPADDGQTFLLEDSFPQKLLPTQMDPKRARKLTLLASLLSNCGKLIVVINFVKNLVIGGALSEMFASIKKMQIMIHLTMTNVNFPANAQIFMSGLFSFVTYNLIDLEGTMRRITGIEDTEQISPNAYFLGYHSVYLLVLISNVLIAILSVLGSLTLFFIAKFTKNERIVKYREELRKKLFWNGVLSVNLEMHLILCICVCIQFKHLNFTDKAKGFSSVLNFVFAIYIIGAMAVSAYIVQKNKSKLNTKSIKEQFGSLYEELNIKRTQSSWVLQEPLISNSRAALLAFVLLFADNYPYFQIFTTNMSVTFMVIFIQWFNVYADPKVRFWNTFNEVFIMLINYHVICFSRLIQDKETIKTMGWSMIVTMVLCIVFNFSNIAYHSGTDSYRKFKTLYLTKKRNALLAKQKILVEQAKNPQISPRLLYLRDEKGIDISQILVKQKWNKKHRPGIEEIKNEIRGYEHIVIDRGEVFVEARIRRDSQAQNDVVDDKQPTNQNLEAEIQSLQIEQIKTFVKRRNSDEFESSQDAFVATQVLILNDQPEGTKVTDEALKALNKRAELSEEAKIDAENKQRLLEEIARAWDVHPDLEQQKSQLIIQDSLAISSLCEDMDELCAQLQQQYGPAIPLKDTKENVIAEVKNTLGITKRMVAPVKSSRENSMAEQSKEVARKNSIKVNMPNSRETKYDLQRQKLKQLAFEPKDQAAIDKELQDKEFWQKYDEAMEKFDKENQRT